MDAGQTQAVSWMQGVGQMQARCMAGKGQAPQGRRRVGQTNAQQQLDVTGRSLGQSAAGRTPFLHYVLFSLIPVNPGTGRGTKTRPRRFSFSNTKRTFLHFSRFLNCCPVFSSCDFWQLYMIKCIGMGFIINRLRIADGRILCFGFLNV